MFAIINGRNLQKLTRLSIRMYSHPSAELEFKKVNQIGTITLNRPKQLNALNLAMVKEMHNCLDAYANDPEIKAVLIKGSGDVAFCAGGDVKKIREDCLNQLPEQALEFFREEYKLNYKIATYKKPYIALLNGVTMGGGVGVSVHGRYRVATEKTLFAMPETAIGFFADVGGSYFLSRLRDHIGLYLVLTGNRVKGQDNKRVGIATHFVSQSNLANLEKELASSNSLDDSKIKNILDGFDEAIEGEYPSAMISQVFQASNLEEIYERLEKDNSEWAHQQIKLLNKMSPTSLKVAIKQLNIGEHMDLKSCLELEYMLVQRFLINSDFFEGVRALLVDKGDKPKWNPVNYIEVDEKRIDWFFRPAPNDERINLAK